MNLHTLIITLVISPVKRLAKTPWKIKLCDLSENATLKFNPKICKFDSNISKAPRSLPANIVSITKPSLFFFF